MDQPLTITSLQVENVKRLRAVRIEPNGKSVVLGGRNAQGKSSVLDSIEMVLNGKDAAPPEPVRLGEEYARIVCKIGELTVTRRFEPNGDSKIVITDIDGQRLKSPQAVLDELVGKLSFDPIAYARMKPAPQYDMLANLLGIDFTAEDKKREQLFDGRTDVNRDVLKLKAQIEGMPVHKDAPEQEVSISEISASLKAAQSKKDEAGEAQKASEGAERALGAARKAVADCEVAIAEIEKQLAAKRANLAKLRDAVPEAERAAVDAAAIAAAAKVAVPDMAPLHKALEDAAETNTKVRANAERARRKAELDAKQKRSDDLSAQIDAIDAGKRKRIDETKFPIEGLTVRGRSVIFNGLPFEQASQAQKLRVSCALGLAMNPRLRVLLIRDASTLDEEGMALMAQLAKEHGAQLWLERVGTGAEVGVVIEDGEVIEVRDTAAQAAE
jgi:hypothetical protein